jgi:hypothetical protein
MLVCLAKLLRDGSWDLVLVKPWLAGGLDDTTVTINPTKSRFYIQIYPVTVNDVKSRMQLGKLTS